MNPTMVGRKWLPQESTPITEKKWCGHCCHRQSRHQSDPKVVRWCPSHSQHSQWTKSCDLIHSRSGCRCCAACTVVATRNECTATLTGEQRHGQKMPKTSEEHLARMRLAMIRIWAGSTCQVSPLWGFESQIDEVPSATNCSFHVRSAFTAQSHNDEVCHIRVAFPDHVQGIGPTGTTSSWNSSDRILQSHTPQSAWKTCKIQRVLVSSDVQQLEEHPHDGCFMRINHAHWRSGTASTQSSNLCSSIFLRNWALTKST